MYINSIVIKNRFQASQKSFLICSICPFGRRKTPSLWCFFATTQNTSKSAKVAGFGRRKKTLQRVTQTSTTLKLKKNSSIPKACYVCEKLSQFWPNFFSVCRGNSRFFFFPISKCTGGSTSGQKLNNWCVSWADNTTVMHLMQPGNFIKYCTAPRLKSNSSHSADLRSFTFLQSDAWKITKVVQKRYW